MEIPKSFKLFHQTIRVEFRKTLVKKSKALGVCLYDKNLILLQEPLDELEIPEDVIEQTFYHELTHMILYKLNYIDLSSNEDLVDRVGNLLHQFISTSQKL